MAVKITEFIKEINETGTFKTNQFYVSVIFPTSGILKKILAELNIKDDLQLQYRIQRITLPSRQMKPVMQKSVFREQRPIPVGYNSFEDLTMQIVLSSDLRERKLFLEWQNKIFNEGGVPAYVDDISGRLEVTTIGSNSIGGEQDPAVAWIDASIHVFEDCWPMMVGDIELSAESSELAMMNVVWQYKNWYMKYQSATERRTLMKKYSAGTESIIGVKVKGVTLTRGD